MNSNTFVHITYSIKSSNCVCVCITVSLVGKLLPPAASQVPCLPQLLPCPLHTSLCHIGPAYHDSSQASACVYDVQMMAMPLPSTSHIVTNMSQKCKHTHDTWHITILHRITTPFFHRIHPHPCLSGCCHVTGTKSSHVLREDDARLVGPTDVTWLDDMIPPRATRNQRGKPENHSKVTAPLRVAEIQTSRFESRKGGEVNVLRLHGILRQRRAERLWNRT